MNNILILAKTRNKSSQLSIDIIEIIEKLLKSILSVALIKSSFTTIPHTALFADQHYIESNERRETSQSNEIFFSYFGTIPKGLTVEVVVSC